MRIGIVLFHAGLAGHVRSALTIARALESSGNNVIFILDITENNVLIKQAGFPIIIIRRGIKGEYLNLTDSIRTMNLDIIHSFNVVGYAETVMSCKRLKIPCTLTICGGRLERRPLNISPLIVFSNELRDAALAANSSLQQNDVIVLPARINVSEYDRNSDKIVLYQAFRRKHGIPDDAKIVLRIGRINERYAQGIKIGALAVEKLYKAGIDIRFVHIGIINTYKDFDEISRLINEVNKRSGIKLAITDQDEAIRGSEYAAMADFSLSVGRSAFESMVLGIPTLISGEKGYLGIVAEENVNEIAYYNFSGRSNKIIVTIEAGTRILCDDISRLLNDNEYSNKVVEFSRKYVVENLDVKIAARDYIFIYKKLLAEGQIYPCDDELSSEFATIPEFIRHRIRNWYIINQFKKLIRK